MRVRDEDSGERIEGFFVVSHPGTNSAFHGPFSVGELEGYVPAETEDRPPIVCLCGSTRFKDTYTAENGRLTLEGCIVLSCGQFAGAGDEVTAEQKEALDRLHREKVRLADEVRIMNVGGYIGESTRREVEFALSLDKPITFLENERPGTVAECLSCGRRGFVPFVHARARREFGMLGWQSVPKRGWMCPACVHPPGEPDTRIQS